MAKQSTIDELIQNGVSIPAPDRIFVAPDVQVSQIESGVSLMPGSRISGLTTVIGKGSVIGAEGPASVNDCQIGRNVVLGSGFFDSSVFLDGSSMGGGAHVRAGCILEEQASGAHTVGLKQTVLLPFVTLGSLINFCDCLMAGGTSRSNHSEVGSSYIHFNFTPHQDKATPSLIGDVVHGVMLDQPPIFLGGQGGLTGPVRIAFGTVVPAGQIIRRDILQPGRLMIPDAAAPVEKEYDPAVYGSVQPRLTNNFSYIGQIYALKLWYRHVREPFGHNDPIAAACCVGAEHALTRIMKERIKRLDELAVKLKWSASILESKNNPSLSVRAAEQKQFSDRWLQTKTMLEEKMKQDCESSVPEELKQSVAASVGSVSYLDWVAEMNVDLKRSVADWLSGVVSEIEKLGVA